MIKTLLKYKLAETAINTYMVEIDHIINIK
jgi:hypothetical protein